MDQCVKEIEAEPDGDDQSDDRFTHLQLLKLTQGVRVEAHKRQKRQTEDHECNVEHDRLLAYAALTAGGRKRSIANGAVGRKEPISFATASPAKVPPERARASEIRSGLRRESERRRQFRKATPVLEPLQSC